MRPIRIFISLSVLLLFSQFTAAQTADEVIDKYVTAVGGMDKLQSVKTAKITGKMINANFEIPFARTLKVPDKIYIEMTMQGMTMKQGCDGTTDWMINPFMGKKDPEKLTEGQTKMMKEQADFEGKFVNYKDKGCSAELEGKDTVEGAEAYKIKLTDKDGDVSHYYIDASTYLLLRESSTMKVKDKEVSTDAYYTDYKPVDGTLIPMTIQVKTSTKGMGEQKIVLDAVELNVAVDDSIFKMPEIKQ